MKGRNGSTSFLPLNKKGGLTRLVSTGKYLTEVQTKYIYIYKVELGDEIKVRNVSQGIQNKVLPHKQLKEKEEIYLYEKVLVSDVNMIDKNKSQMEQWSILSDNIVYVRSVGYDEMNGVDIKMVDYQDYWRMYKRMGKEEGQRMNIDIGKKPTSIERKIYGCHTKMFLEEVVIN